MKNIAQFIALIFSLTYCSGYALSQSTCELYHCCSAPTQSQNVTQSVENRDSENCTLHYNDASNAFHERYKKVQNYIPYPNSPVAVKTIRINMVIVGINGEYPFIWENDDLNATMTNEELLNFSFSGVIGLNPSWTTSNGFPCPEPINPDYLSDSKIRIEVANVRYINSSYFAECNSHSILTELISHHIGLYPNDNDQLNWYFTRVKPGTGAGEVIGVTIDGESYSVINSAYVNLPYTGQHDMIHCHLSHEIGHTLDLHHTYGTNLYQNGGAADYIQWPEEHLDDVFSGESEFDVSIDGHSFGGCHNIMGGGCHNRWTSPKQMGRMHRALSMPILHGFSSANVTPEIRNYAYGFSEIPIEITQDELWNFPMKSYNDIIVKRGATLTITCRLEMVPQAKIVVEPGGKLIVDGGTITSAKCGGPDKEGLWRGIEVWGQSMYNQNSVDAQGISRQGSVYIINGALIEHAQVAIQANRPGQNNHGGGIIMVEESTIKNCWKGIHFARYIGFQNISRIKDSHFEIDDEWKLANNPVNFIEGWQVRKVGVSNNTFINNNAQVRINGIYLEDANMEIIGTKHNSISVCDYENEEWEPNRFINLNKGILGIWLGNAPAHIDHGYTPVILKNIFINCNYSIVNQGMPHFRADANKIIMGGHDEGPRDIVGIYQIGGVNYSIVENCITQIGTPINTVSVVGIAVWNTGGDNHAVYKNQTHDVQYGYLAMERNRSSQGETSRGLQFICNENYGNQLYDFSVTSLFTNDPMTGIRELQNGYMQLGSISLQAGNSAKDAGNLFSPNCTTNSNIDFENDVINSIVYFYTQSPPKIPECYSTGTIAIELYLGSSTTCQTKFPIPGTLPDTDPVPNPDDPDGRRNINDILIDFTIANSQFLATAILFNSVIDNGDPQSLMQYIYPNANISSTDIRLGLLNVSPNISREMMALLIEENTIITNDDLLQIIAANPDIARDEELLLMLVEKANPLDLWMIEFLRNIGTYTTDRTALEWLFSNQTTLRHSLAWEMVSALIESDTATYTQIYSWLDIIGTPRAIYIKVDDLISRGQYTEAHQLLNSMNVEKLARWEKIEHSRMVEWTGLKEDLFLTNRTLNELDSTELEMLREIADDAVRSGIVGVYAKNILNLYEPEMHEFELVLPNPNRSMQREKRILKPLPLVNEMSMEVFPNPAENRVTLEFSDKVETGNIIIYSASGEKLLSLAVVNSVFSVVDVSKLPQGIYIAILTNAEGQKLAETKISVQR